jgi:negative regulator of flagellin synthesis FlgM
MEITPKNQTTAIDAYNTTQVQLRPKTESNEGKVSGQQGLKADTVFISDTAKRIQDAQNQLQSIPDVRADKVAELKSRIENGTYEIKPDRIADKMIRESLLNDLFK